MVKHKSTNSIFDFAVDGSRSVEILYYFGDREIYKELLKNGWKNEKQREELLHIVGRKIANTNPGLIVSSDALFWDSVPRFLARIHSSKDISIFTKIFTSDYVREKILGKVVYPIKQEERMISDF